MLLNISVSNILRDSIVYFRFKCAVTQLLSHFLLLSLFDLVFFLVFVHKPTHIYVVLAITSLFQDLLTLFIDFYDFLSVLLLG